MSTEKDQETRVTIAAADQKEAMLREQVLIVEAARFERARIREWAEGMRRDFEESADRWDQGYCRAVDNILDFLKEPE